MEGDTRRRRYRGNSRAVEWSEELWEQVLAHARMGFPISCVASEVGISRERLQRWLAESDVMREEMDLALQRAEFRLTATIIQGTREDHKFALSVAKIRYPDTWRDETTVHFDHSPEVAEGAMAKFDAFVAAIEKTKARPEQAEGA